MLKCMFMPVDLTIHLSNEIILLLELVNQPAFCVDLHIEARSFSVWGFSNIGSQNDQVLFTDDPYTDVLEN